mgnify:CR=1 FL=1
MSRIVVLGAGESGAGAAVLAKVKGFDTFVSDMSAIKDKYKELLNKHGIAWEEGQHTEELILNADEVVKSPGIPNDAPLILKLKEKGMSIISEIEFAGRYTNAKMICITGSNGKTTTTSLIYHIFKSAGLNVGLAGNIGNSLALQVAMEKHDYYVIELSSFQLMTMQKSPHIAVTTNLAPNHLDVHKDYQEYVDAKANIFTHQTAGDIAVFNADNDDTVRQAAKAVGEVRWFSRKQRVDNGVFCENGVIYEAANGTVTPIMETKDVLLPGVHNIENYMAAFAAVRGMVSYETMREIAKTFGGVEHRIELIRTRKGVRWYNDSIASSPSRTIAGLNSFPEQVILIAGGKDKGISYAPLGPVVNDHVKLLLLCGKTAGVIREAVEQAENYHGLEILDVADYHEAVAIADARSQPGDVVILSPASTSFDRFANFMERGQVFKAIVNELK